MSMGELLWRKRQQLPGRKQAARERDGCWPLICGWAALYTCLPRRRWNSRHAVLASVRCMRSRMNCHRIDGKTCGGRARTAACRAWRTANAAASCSHVTFYAVGGRHFNSCRAAPAIYRLLPEESSRYAAKVLARMPRRAAKARRAALQAGTHSAAATRRGKEGRLRTLQRHRDAQTLRGCGHARAHGWSRYAPLL